MKKIILIFLLFIFSPNCVFAGNDLTITCTNNSCSKSSNLPLFSELNIAPGSKNTQSVKVINNRSDNCNLLFKLNSNSSSNQLFSVQTISIVSDNTVWYAGAFNNLFDNNNHQLGNIDSNQYKNYQWTISLNQSAGNEYQSLNTSFNIDFNFTCGEDNSSSDSLCHDIPPTLSPQNLKAIPKNNSVTLFWDEPNDSFTYYLISYADNKNADTFANPNVGAKGTKSFTVNNLSADTLYYFKIRTGNGCASGPFSDTVSTTPSGQILSNPKTTSFQGDVLGIQNTMSQIANNTDNFTSTNIIPFAFLLAFIVNLILYRYRLVTFIISLLSFVFDYYLNQFTTHKLPYFYLGSLLSFLLPLIFSYIKTRNNYY